MNVSGLNSVERFQAAIQAAKKRNKPQEVTAPATKNDKIAMLQEKIKQAKKVMPASVGGTAFHKIYGGNSQVKSRETAPKVGMKFDVYA